MYAKKQQYSMRARNMDSNLSQYSTVFTKLRKQSEKIQMIDKKTSFQEKSSNRLQSEKNQVDVQLRSNYIRSLQIQNTEELQKRMCSLKTEVDINIPIPINIFLVGNGLPRLSDDEQKNKKQTISLEKTIRTIFLNQFKKKQISTDQIIKSIFAGANEAKTEKKYKIILKPLLQKHLLISNVDIDLKIIMTLSSEEIKNNEYSQHIKTWNNLESPKLMMFFVHNTNFQDFKHIHNFISNISCQNIEKVKKSIKQSIKSSTVNQNKIYKQISGMLIVDNTQYQYKDKGRDKFIEVDMNQNKIMKEEQYIRFAQQYNLLYIQTTTSEQSIKKCNQWFAFLALLKFSQFGLYEKIRYYTDKVQKGLEQFGVNIHQLYKVQLKQLGYKQNKKLQIYQQLSRQVGEVKQKIIQKLGQIYGGMCQLSRSLKQINNQITNQLNKYNGYQSIFAKENVEIKKQSNNVEKQSSKIYYEEQRKISEKIQKITNQKIKIIKHMKILQTIENNINSFKLGYQNNDTCTSSGDNMVNNQRNSYTKLIKTIRQSQRYQNNHINKQMQVFNKIQNIEQYYIKILLTTFTYSSYESQTKIQTFNSSHISKQTRSSSMDKQFVMKMQNIFRGEADLINVYDYEKTRQYMQKILSYLTQKQEEIKNLKNTLYVEYCRRNKIVTQLWQNLQSYTKTLQQMLQKIKTNSQIEKEVSEGQRNQIKNTIMDMIKRTKLYLSDIMEEKEQIRWEINTYISVFDRIQNIIGYDFGIVEELTNRWDIRYSGKNFVRGNVKYSDQIKKVDEKNQLFEEYLIQFFLNKLTEQLQIILNKSIKNTKQEIKKPNLTKSPQKTQKSQGYLVKLSLKYKQFAEYMHGLSLQFYKKQDSNKNRVKQINKQLLVDIHNYQTIKKADGTRVQQLIYIMKQNQNKIKQELKKKQKRLKNKKSGSDIDEMNVLFASCLKPDKSDEKKQQYSSTLNKPILQMTFTKEKEKVLSNPYAQMKNHSSTIPQSYTWQEMDFQKCQISPIMDTNSNQNSAKSQNQIGYVIMRDQIQLDFSLLLKKNQNI